MPLVVQLGIAVLIGAVILWLGITTLRAASGSGRSMTRPEVEEVEELQVFLVCRECGTELQVTRLGEMQIPRHCGEPMELARRPSEGSVQEVLTRYDLPALNRFLQEVFHPRWALDDPTPRQAVVRHVGRAGPGSLREVVDDIDRLLGSTRDEGYLRWLVLEDMGSPYDPARQGLGIASWLDQVRETLATRRV